jgi:glutathione synthase/RimK-type ligase-like ATP-grasp enzyme
MRILLFNIHPQRKAIARLPKALKSVGFKVAILCTPQSFLSKTRHTDRQYLFKETKAAGKLWHHLQQAMKDWQPVLIIPGDEMAVAFLHYLVRQSQNASGSISTDILKVLMASLGEPHLLSATLFKDQTLRITRELEIKAPASSLVTTLEDALNFTHTYGYPTVLKKGFSWGGEGVKVCLDEAQLRSALPAFLPRRPNSLKAFLRGRLQRDWYPSHTTLEIQQFIHGQPSNVCLVALEGKVLAGFAAIPEQTSSTTGPSSVVCLRSHPEMMAAATTLVEYFRYTGFIGFDFLLSAKTGKAYLLECNPRPTPASHLGSRISVDLCQALFAGLSGKTFPPQTTVPHETIVTLFPDEWIRDPSSSLLRDYYHDVPWDDQRLVMAHVNFEFGKLESFPLQHLNLPKQAFVSGDPPMPQLQE